MITNLLYELHATAMQREDDKWYPGCKQMLNGKFDRWIEWQLPFDSEYAAMGEALELVKLEAELQRKIFIYDLSMLSEP